MSLAVAAAPMAIINTLEDNNLNNTSDNSSSHTSSHTGTSSSDAMSSNDNENNVKTQQFSSADSDVESEESDGGWSDEDGDSDTEDHDDDPVLKQPIYNNVKSTKKQAAAAAPISAAPPPPQVPDINSAPNNGQDLSAMDPKQLKLAMQRKRLESMQQQQLALEEQCHNINTKSPPTNSITKKKLNNEAIKRGNKSPRSEKERLREEEEEESSSESESDSDSDDESSSSSDESESSSDEESTDSEQEEERENAQNEVDIARQEQNVKTVQQVLNVDCAAHQRFLAFMKKKNSGGGTSTSQNNNQQEESPKTAPKRIRRKSKPKYTSLGDSIGSMNMNMNGSQGELMGSPNSGEDHQDAADRKQAKKERKEKKKKKKKGKKSDKKKGKKAKENGGFDWTAYSKGDGKLSSKDRKVPKRIKSDSDRKLKKKIKDGIKPVQRSKSDLGDVGSPTSKKRGKRKPSKATPSS